MTKFQTTTLGQFDNAKITKSRKEYIDLSKGQVNEFINYSEIDTINESEVYIKKNIKTPMQKAEFSVHKEINSGKDNFARIIFHLGNLENLRDYYSRNICVEFIAFSDSIAEIQLELIKKSKTSFIDKVMDECVILDYLPSFYQFPLICEFEKRMSIDYYLQFVIFNRAFCGESASYFMYDLSITFDKALV